MKNTMQAIPAVNDVAKPTMLTITAPSVAPICGIRSQIATTTASANGYASPTIGTNTQVLTPATTAIASAPTMYAPTLARTLVAEQLDRVAAGRRPQPVRGALDPVEGRHEVDGQYEDGQDVEDRAEEQPGAADDPAQRVRDRAGVQRALHPLQDLVPHHQVVDGLVALQAADEVGGVVDELDSLGDKRRDECEQAPAEEQQDAEGHRQHGEAARHAPLPQPGHGGIEAHGQEQRDEDEEQDRGRVAQAGEDPVRQQQAEPAQETDKERVAVERPPGLAEPARRWRVGARLRG